jgi:type III secretion system FlhB-like substrate exporter
VPAFGDRVSSLSAGDSPSEAPSLANSNQSAVMSSLLERVRSSSVLMTMMALVRQCLPAAVLNSSITRCLYQLVASLLYWFFGNFMRLL